MCGIFGIVNNSPSPKSELNTKVNRGINRIRHRGPDGQGIWVEPEHGIGFGHVRLSIIDLASGAQPMRLEDGTVITFNGEIYNYPELREELGVSLFQTTSDTEVILRSYQRWGEDCVQHFRGMFAFLIWDPRKKAVFFARDRFGIKPLFWFKDISGSVFFASEIKAFLPFIENQKINDRYGH